jgi:uncharacterized protein with GYD domain
MGYYLIQVAYTADAVKTLVKTPQNREDAARKAIESLGGKLHSFFFCFGDYDVVLIAEAPDNTTAAAMALATTSAGALSKFHTTTLLTTAEGMDAMKLAKKASYKPPK